MDKHYRIYFNRAQDAPHVWSIDEGDQSTEINVIGVVVKASADAHIKTCYNGEKPNEDSPVAWLELNGPVMLWIEDGIAYFA